MPAQKRPLPSSAAADVEEAHPGPGADADGARRSPKPTLNGAEERDGWKRQGKDRRHGTAGLLDHRARRRPRRRARIARCGCLCMGCLADRALVSWALCRFRR
nr:unnamed protein product [Digitaria exilis]